MSSDLWNTNIYRCFTWNIRLGDAKTPDCSYLTDIHFALIFHLLKKELSNGSNSIVQNAVSERCSPRLHNQHLPKPQPQGKRPLSP